MYRKQDDIVNCTPHLAFPFARPLPVAFRPPTAADRLATGLVLHCHILTLELAPSLSKYICVSVTVAEHHHLGEEIGKTGMQHTRIVLQVYWVRHGVLQV